MVGPNCIAACTQITLGKQIYTKRSVKNLPRRDRRQTNVLPFSFPFTQFSLLAYSLAQMLTVGPVVGVTCSAAHQTHMQYFFCCQQCQQIQSILCAMGSWVTFSKSSLSKTLVLFLSSSRTSSQLSYYLKHKILQDKLKPKPFPHISLKLIGQAYNFHGIFPI